MSLLSSLSQLLGYEKKRTLNTNLKGTVKHEPIPEDRIPYLNAEIAAGGARAYEAAHPGKKYTPGQNGEIYDGGIDMPTYQRLLGMPVVSTAPKVSQNVPLGRFPSFTNGQQGFAPAETVGEFDISPAQASQFGLMENVNRLQAGPNRLQKTQNIRGQQGSYGLTDNSLQGNNAMPLRNSRRAQLR